MAAPRREATGRVGAPLRAFPVVAVAASIVAVALHYNGFVRSGLTVPRASSTFDVRKNAVYACPMDRTFGRMDRAGAGGAEWRWSLGFPTPWNFISI